MAPEDTVFYEAIWSAKVTGLIGNHRMQTSALTSHEVLGPAFQS